MKKSNLIFKMCFLLTIILMVFTTTGCVNDSKVSVITPTGTPSLGISNALSDEKLIKCNIVAGSDPLIGAFTNANYDIILAPVNLGAKFYNSNPNFQYVLYETIVWGNYYLASTKEIKSFSEMDGQKLLVFGKNSTPDVVVRTLIASLNLDVELEYVDDVSTANSYLIAGKADYIVSAEPSLTKVQNNQTIYTLDLQSEWQKLTNSYELPQAGIFVKKSKLDNTQVKKALEKMIESVEMASSDPNSLVEQAVSIDEALAKIGSETLKSAISRCNLRTNDKQKEAIEFYFNKVIELGIGQTVGGKLPDEAFYYQK